MEAFVTHSIYKKYIRSADTLVDVVVNASDDVLKPGVEVMKQYPLSQLKSGDGFRWILSMHIWIILRK